MHADLLGRLIYTPLLTNLVHLHNVIVGDVFKTCITELNTQLCFWLSNCAACACIVVIIGTIRMEVASSWLDQLPTLFAAKTSELSLLVKLPFWWRSSRCRQCCSDFLLQCAGDIEADNTDSYGLRRPKP